MVTRNPGAVRDDVFGGMVAAFVTLPVALSLGALSGMGPAAGIYGAIAVGAVAAVSMVVFSHSTLASPAAATRV